jgi:hypothetical protein
LEPKEYTVFGLALDRCRADPRVAVRLGSPLSGYGVESSSRSARQRIRHKIETDAAGVEHILIQFQLRGPRGVGTVFAEGVKDGAAPGGYRLGFIRLTDPSGAGRPIAVLPAEERGGFGAPLPAGLSTAPPPPPQFALAGEGLMSGGEGGSAGGGGGGGGAGARAPAKSIWGTFLGR